MRSAAVPRLSLADGLLYTIERTDTLQLAGTIVRGRVIYQGTLSGILRIAPANG